MGAGQLAILHMWSTSSSRNRPPTTSTVTGISSLESKEVEKVPLYIQRFRLILMKYNVQVVQISGKNKVN